MIFAVREDGGEIFEVPFFNETSTWFTYLLISYPKSNQLEILLLKPSNHTSAMPERKPTESQFKDQYPFEGCYYTSL